MIPTRWYTEIVSDAWVDGRYVSAWEHYVQGAHYEDYPTADVVVHDMHYMDVNGNEHTQDVLFKYNSLEDNWQAYSYEYYGGFGSAPACFTLTREQVKAMHVDAKTDIPPLSGLMYDGTVYPGTPFANSIDPDFVLPASVKTIEAEAFQGGRFHSVKTPYGALRIEERAFADCSSLCQIEIPSTVTKIADNSFEGCTNVIIICTKGSYASRYAANHGMETID